LGWSSNPGAFCNGRCVGLLFYIYYTKNFTLFKNFIKFMASKESFDLCGKKYKLSACEDYPVDILNEDRMRNFLIELEQYIDNKLIPKFADRKADVDKWIADTKHFFEPVTTNAPAITVYFESKTMTPLELSGYSKYFMGNLITDYYHQDHDSIGNKISIYQLNIKYNIEIQKKENPEYEKWFKKYGKKETPADKSDGKDSKDAKDSSDSKKEDKKDETKTTTTTTDSSSTAIVDSNNAGADAYDMMDDYYGFPYAHGPGRHYRGYKYRPPEPNKFIEEEISTPLAETKYIKSDKKPLQYLYLQKTNKVLLESYLSNFKNNRKMYEKFGIPYKGGIILSGEPGCGKSSTIMAIATYLNKDIFYMDLGKVKTNHELKLCVDFVKTNSQKGGIIIFEDIDCMTDIVISRSIKINELSNSQNNQSESLPSNNSITKNMDSQNDALSLSFLLNILDGPMAPENVIFIMTTNHKEILDPALIRPGRMDISITIDKCDKHQLQQIYFDLFGKNLKEDTVKRFKEYQFITAEIILHLFHNIYNRNAEEEEMLKIFLN
jgi:hypothetical protein